MNFKKKQFEKSNMCFQISNFDSFRIKQKRINKVLNSLMMGKTLLFKIIRKYRLFLNLNNKFCNCNVVSINGLADNK